MEFRKSKLRFYPYLKLETKLVYPTKASLKLWSFFYMYSKVLSNAIPLDPFIRMVL